MWEVEGERETEREKKMRERERDWFDDAMLLSNPSKTSFAY